MGFADPWVQMAVSRPLNIMVFFEILLTSYLKSLSYFQPYIRVF